MKLKKLLASVTAAVMAVTAMAFSSLTASAANDIFTFDFADRPYTITFLIKYQSGSWGCGGDSTRRWLNSGESYTYGDIKNQTITINWTKLTNLTEYSLTEKDLQAGIELIFNSSEDENISYFCNKYHMEVGTTGSTTLTVSDVKDNISKFDSSNSSSTFINSSDMEEASVLEEIALTLWVKDENLTKIAEVIGDVEEGDSFIINSGAVTPSVDYEDGGTAEEEPLQPTPDPVQPTPDPVQPSPDPMQSTPPQTNSNTAPTAGIPGAIIGAKKPAETTAADTSSDAGGSTSVELKTPAKITKELIDSVSGKDNVELKLDEGVTWEFAVSDLGKAEGMDLSVILDTDDITKAQADSISKESETMQFRIVHDGEFGFTAKLNIPVASRYDGLYANLYRLNGDELEYVCSSLVENKIASFDMDHASSYIIFFNRVSFVENIATGAGIYADESGTSSAAPIAVCISFAALAAVSAVIIKKRA